MTTLTPGTDTLEPHVSAMPSDAHSRVTHTSRRTQRRLTIVLLMSIVALGIAGSLVVQLGLIANPFHGSHSTTSSSHEGHVENRDTIPTVKVIKPKREASAELILERIATVEPYFRADLRARASGIVKTVLHDIGEPVKRGEVLVEIDVAEFEQDVAQKEALIVQRQYELKVSEAEYQNAKSAAGVTAAVIAQRKAEIHAIEATRDLRKSRYERYKDLAAKGSVVGSVVEEEEKDYQSSEGALQAAQANVERAEADHAASQSKVSAATAEIELKRSQIEVARRDLDRAKVVANFGKVTAPFDGVVVRRNVDPGSFVQNATTGSSETLISVSRIDLLTVVAQFPDNAAPYIAEGTQAIIQIEDLSGDAIFAKVTRFSPTIQNSDRTIRVEVDLFNGGPSARQKLQATYDKNHSLPQLKGSKDTLPLPAFTDDRSSQSRLLPGMNGSIKLVIGGSGQSYNLPSSAVYSRSGVTYILTVVNGKTREVPVRIILNDGRKVRLSIVERKTRDDGAEHEFLTELSGDVNVVAANQLQVGDGVEVRAASTDW